MKRYNKKALDIFSSLLIHMSTKQINNKNTPSFFVFCFNDYKYIQKQFIKLIVENTDYFRKSFVNDDLWECSIFWNCHLYFCNEKSFNENILSGRCGDIYCYVSNKNIIQYKSVLDKLKSFTENIFYVE